MFWVYSNFRKIYNKNNEIKMNEDLSKGKPVSTVLKINLASIISYGSILSNLIDFLEAKDILAVDSACNGSDREKWKDFTEKDCESIILIHSKASIQ